MLNNQELEIEVAYLLKDIPEDLLFGVPIRIVDVYFTSDSDLLSKLRLRQKGEKYEITKKVNIDPNDLSMQEEFTIPLTEQEFTTLRAAGGRELVKDRYLIPLDDHTMEVDVFRNNLEGLVLAEVEFKTQEDRDAFTAPEYFGTDVTQENFVAGAYLAGKSIDDIRSELERVS